MKNIVKNSMLISLITQFITLIIGITMQFKNVSTINYILKYALGLENFVQLIEGTFYLWFSYFSNKSKFLLHPKESRWRLVSNRH